MQKQQNFSDLEVYVCTFETHIQQAVMTIKFPCTYMIQLKSMNNKITMATTKNKVSAINSVATFNQTLRFQVEVLYNKKQKTFLKKDILLLLNLISTRRPDQQKLVGRVTIDLSQVIHTLNYGQLQPHKLDYCSVNAQITFSAKFIGKKISTTSPQNFDRDSFSQFQSFVAGINKDNPKDNPSKQKSFQEAEKTIQMPWKNKGSEGMDKNRIIQQSHNQDAESRVNTGRTSHKNVPIADNILQKPMAPSSSSQQFTHPKMTLVDDHSHESSLKNLHNLHNQITQSPIAAESHPEQQFLSRVKSDVSERSYSRKELIQASPLYTQPINQYEEILRSSHAQQKRIWDEQKRLLNEQISREKLENIKYKQRNDTLEKKLYETELKLCNIEGKIQNSKRQMTILQREKDLELKQIKSRLERITKQKNEKTQFLQSKQAEFRQLKEKLRTEEFQKKKGNQQHSKEYEKLQERLQSAIKKVSSSEQIINKLQTEKKSIENSLHDQQKKFTQLLTQNNQLKTKASKILELQQQINILKTQRIESERKNMQKQDKNRKIYEQQTNKLLSQISKIEQQYTLKIKQLQIDFQQSKQQQSEQIESLKGKIDELEGNLQQKQIAINDLQLQLDQKDSKLERTTQEYSKKLLQSQKKEEEEINKLLTQNQLQIDSLKSKIMELQLTKSVVEQKIIRAQDQINEKNYHIQLLQASNQQLESKFKQLEQSYNDKIINLEISNEQLTKKVGSREQQLRQANKNIDKMKQVIQQMKSYEKGLQQELLKVHDNNLEEHLNTLSIQEKKISKQFEQFEIQTSHKIAGLENVIDQLNIVINQRNLEIQKLMGELNDGKEYVMGLEAEILKRSQEAENQDEKRKHSSLLQKQINKLREQSRHKDEELDKIKLENLQLKQYHLGLEEQLLKMTQEVSKLQARNSEFSLTSNPIQQMAKPKLSSEFSKKSSQDRQNRHASIKVMQQKIIQLESTLQQQKQYAMGLQQKILNDHEKLSFKFNKIKQLQDHLQHQKQYQIGLQQKILEDHDKIQQQKNNMKNSVAVEQDMLTKIRTLEETIKNQREYQEGLELKILQDHEIMTDLINQSPLKNSINMASSLISGVPQGELVEKIKKLENTIEQQKQYQQGLEQKILEDHENEAILKQSLTGQGILMMKIKQLQDTIKAQKEYQEGLQQKILEDHENKQNQLALKSSIGDLQYKLKQSKQYQEGLEQKILDDHEKIYTMKNKFDEFIQNISSKDVDQPHLMTDLKHEMHKQERVLHEKCRIQRKKLEDIISQLEQNLYKISQHSPAKREDEDYLALQEKINQNQQYISELENDIKRMQKQIYKLEEHVGDLKMQLEHHGDEEELENHFGTVIRVISAHDPSSEEQERQVIEENEGTLGNKIDKKIGSISQISQPPRMKNLDSEMSDDYSMPSSPNRERPASWRDTPSKEPVMEIISEQEEIKNKNQQIKTLSTLVKDKEQKITEALQKVSQKQQQVTRLLKQLHELKDSKLKQVQSQIPQSQIHKYEQSILKLQQKIKQKQIELSTTNKHNQIKVANYEQQVTNLKNKIQAIQARHNEEKSADQMSTKVKQCLQYIEELQSLNRQYESRIKMLKNKEVRIEQTLTVIEQESIHIVNQLEAKDRQNQELRGEIGRLNQRYEQLRKKQPQNRQSRQIKQSRQSRQSSQITTTKEEYLKLKKENEQRQQENSLLRQRVSQLETAADQTQDKKRIKQLQASLAQLDQQLTVNKRLIGRLRQSKSQSQSQVIPNENIDAIKQSNNSLLKRVEQLEEEMFVYQANENEKDIEIEVLRNQIRVLKQALSTRSPIDEVAELVDSPHKQQQHEISRLNNEIDQLRHRLQQQNKNTTKQIQENQQKQQKIKQQQAQLHKLQTLMKAQRLQYFNKRRQINQHKDQALRQNEEYINKLQQKEVEMNQLKGLLALAQKKLREQEQNSRSGLQELKKSLSQQQFELEQKNEEIHIRRKESMKQLDHTKQLEAQIADKDQQIQLKDQEIQQLKNTQAGANKNTNANAEQQLRYQLKQTQNQLNFYSEQLQLITRKYEELQPKYYALIQASEQHQKTISQLHGQLQIAHQQNQFTNTNTRKAVNRTESNKSQKSQRSDINAINQTHAINIAKYQEQKKALATKIDQLQQELVFVKESQEANDNENMDKIHQLENKLKHALDAKDKAMEELEERQMEHMNTQLDLQFKLREKNEKSQLQIARSITDNQLRKSLNASQDIGANDLVTAAKTLKELLSSRTNRVIVEKQIEVMVVRITQLQQQLFSSTSAAKEKGLILEKTRLMSMQFSKLKSNILKSKLNNEERMKLLTSLRPLQSTIKDVLKLSEIYSQNLLSQDVTAENVRT